MEYLRRLRNFWAPEAMAVVWLLFALPVLHFVQTTVHEGTHALSTLFVTGSFPKLATFPHQSSSGGFLNGVTIADRKGLVSVVERTSCDSKKKERLLRIAGLSANPQFVALGLIALFTTIFLVTTTANPFLRLGVRSWYFAACLDFLYNTLSGLWGGCKEAADWTKFRFQADLGTGVFVFLTWLFWLAILSHFVWVYWARWSRDPVERTGFWDYRWVAMTLGILSFFAVLLALVVGDPKIDKTSAAYIVPFVVQVGVLGWYWTYFGLTFKYKR